MKSNKFNNQSYVSKLRIQREMQGLSQEFVAFELGISQSAYANLESGKTIISLHRAIELSKIFKLGLCELFAIDSNSEITKFRKVNYDHQLLKAIEYFKLNNENLFQNEFRIFTQNLLLLVEYLVDIDNSNRSL